METTQGHTAYICKQEGRPKKNTDGSFGCCMCVCVHLFVTHLGPFPLWTPTLSGGPVVLMEDHSLVLMWLNVICEVCCKLRLVKSIQCPGRDSCVCWSVRLQKEVQHQPWEPSVYNYRASQGPSWLPSAYTSCTLYFYMVSHTVSPQTKWINRSLFDGTIDTEQMLAHCAAAPVLAWIDIAHL